jgi:HKD family nuclease
MIRLSFLRPIDQFSGTRRFLQEFKNLLAAPQYDELLISVAFAKSGPLLRLASLINQWRQLGKRARAIVGVDMNGTSKQALELALAVFDEVFVTHSTSHSTFHPKFYLFYGDRKRFASMDPIISLLVVPRLTLKEAP